MEIKELAKFPSLHHAYIVVGDAREGRKEVLRVLEKRGVPISSNLDLLTVELYDMKVDDVRDTIVPFSSLTPLGDRKYCVVSFMTANANAQNALLKVVEESPGATTFFFCVDTLGLVLPTLRSRCIMLHASRPTASPGEMHDAKEFMFESYASRMARIEKMVSNISKTQERTDARAFTQIVLGLAHAMRLPASSLKDLLAADRYLRMPGSSPKIIFGHLAATLPRKSTTRVHS